MTSRGLTAGLSQPSLDDAARLLRDGLRDAEPVFIQVGESSAQLPADAAAVVATVIDLLGQGRAVEVESLPPVLTTGQAADLLGVSRPTVVALIDDGTLPAERIRTHRRVRTQDVLAYRSKRAAERSTALDELTRLSEEMGLYDG